MMQPMDGGRLKELLTYLHPVENMDSEKRQILWMTAGQRKFSHFFLAGVLIAIWTTPI